MKSKLLTSRSEYQLERDLNTFLSKIVEYKNILFSSSLTGGGEIEYSVLIIYN